MTSDSANPPFASRVPHQPRPLQFGQLARYHRQHPVLHSQVKILCPCSLLLGTIYLLTLLELSRDKATAKSSIENFWEAKTQRVEKAKSTRCVCSFNTLCPTKGEITFPKVIGEQIYRCPCLPFRIKVVPLTPLADIKNKLPDLRHEKIDKLSLLADAGRYPDVGAAVARQRPTALPTRGMELYGSCLLPSL